MLPWYYPTTVYHSQDTADAKIDCEVRLTETDKVLAQARGMLIELASHITASEAVERDLKTRLAALELIVGERVTQEPHAIREALQYCSNNIPMSSSQRSGD